MAYLKPEQGGGGQRDTTHVTDERQETRVINADMPRLA